MKKKLCLIPAIILSITTNNLTASAEDAAELNKPLLPWNLTPKLLWDLSKDNLNLLHRAKRISDNDLNDPDDEDIPYIEGLNTPLLKFSRKKYVFVITPPWDLTKTPDVKALSVDGELLNDEIVITISKLKHLEYLEIGRSDFKVEWFSVLLNLSKLRHLDINGRRISYMELLVITRFANLETLNLSYIDLTDEEVCKLCAQFPKLKYLIKIKAEWQSYMSPKYKDLIIAKGIRVFEKEEELIQ